MSNKRERNKRELRVSGEDPRQLVTIEETSNFLQLHEATIRKLIKNGCLEARKVAVEIDGHIRRKTRILRQSVKKFIGAGEQ